MEGVRSALDTVLNLLWQGVTIIMGAIVAVDAWLRATMSQVGVPVGVQSIVVILAALMLFLLAFKVLSGFLRILLILFLALLVVQAFGLIGNGPRRVEIPVLIG